MTIAEPMIELQIDGRTVAVDPGATVLEAARKLGIRIPTLCHRDGHPALTSCMVCVVRVNGARRLVPSCATRVAPGMAVESETPEVQAARRTAMELLLGDHLGDCIGPCQGVCPAHMDIPKMIREIHEGRLRDAIITIKDRIALPAVLGRICPEICEHGCRRAVHDGSVSVCLLKRFAADEDLNSGDPYLPSRLPPTGKRVAIAGTGPAGLAAAYLLQQLGHACILFDRRSEPGGMLRYGVTPDRLPPEVLDAEIDLVRRLGAEFRVDEDPGLPDLQAGFDAVLIAAGPLEKDAPIAAGLARTAQGIKVDRASMQTSEMGVFAAGASVTPTRHAVRSLASGRSAALGIDHFLSAESGARLESLYTVHIGKVHQEEIGPYLEGADPAGRTRPAPGNGLSREEAHCEAGRCLRCDCQAQESCQLRHWAAEYGASPARFRGDRKPFERRGNVIPGTLGEMLLFEPGKCIDCGICIDVAREAGAPLGLSFSGRGFSMRVTVPFGGDLATGLAHAAGDCAEACPTGALVVDAEGCRGLG